MAGISVWQMLIVLAIIVLLFGTKKLRNIGGDLGQAFRGFRDSMKQGRKAADTDQDPAPPELGSDSEDIKAKAEVSEKTATKEKP